MNGKASNFEGTLELQKGKKQQVGTPPKIFFEGGAASECRTHKVFCLTQVASLEIRNF